MAALVSKPEDRKELEGQRHEREIAHRDRVSSFTHHSGSIRLLARPLLVGYWFVGGYSSVLFKIA